MELLGVGRVGLLAIIAHAKEEKTCIGVTQNFKGKISSSTTLKPSIHYQPQDLGLVMKAFNID
jgi:hypothetical protein